MLDQLSDRKLIFVYWSIRPYLKVYKDSIVCLVDTLTVREEIEYLRRISFSIFLDDFCFDNRVIAITLDYLKDFVSVVCNNSAVIQIAQLCDLYCMYFLA